MTLISVAADLPVPLLTNTTAEGANGWRAHIAIVLANLHSQAAMNTVYQLGLALSQVGAHLFGATAGVTSFTWSC